MGTATRKADAKLITRYVIRGSWDSSVMGVALFWSAGQIGWWPAWAALAVMLAWVAATAIIVIWINPRLLAERLGPRQGAKRWDTAIMSILGIVQLARYVVAGLDQRYDWTGDLPIATQVAALGVCILSQALVVWATASNAFFSQIVRVQLERGHTVATGGPYRFVRHPAYLGAIAYELAVPILLASWWALAISSLNAILLVVRTALEDRALRAELAGYEDYALQTRRRLIPGVW